MEITISGNNKEYLTRVEKLARELGLSIKKTKVRNKASKDNADALYELMTKKANSGGIESIKDPIAWQKEVRKDKKLYGREE